MISGKNLLPLLVGMAIGAGGWLHGLRNGASVSGEDTELLQDRLRIAEEELEILISENESLRSLAQGGGAVSVPQEMIDAVEKDYALRFISSPVVNRVATEELGYRIEAALESRLGPQGMDDRQEAYQRIGWIAAGDNLLQQLVAVRSVGALAWFDEQTGEGWVTDRFDLKNVPDQAAMLRLLVRILLNQHFAAPVAYQGDDAARAREALHAGAASGAEARFYASSARSIGFLQLPDNGPAQRLMLSLPPFVQGITMFPVVSGRALADTHYVKGAEGFADLFRKPPETTYGVVLPAEEKRGGDLENADLENEVFLNESGGYLGLRLWLEEMGDVGKAEELARGWQKDGYSLFADGETSSGLLWEIEMESEELADELEKAMRERVEAMKAMNEDRFFDVLRVSSLRVCFINAATAETLAQLDGK